MSHVADSTHGYCYLNIADRDQFEAERKLRRRRTRLLEGREFLRPRVRGSASGALHYPLVEPRGGKLPPGETEEDSEDDRAALAPCKPYEVHVRVSRIQMAGPDFVSVPDIFEAGWKADASPSSIGCAPTTKRPLFSLTMMMRTGAGRSQASMPKGWTLSAVASPEWSLAPQGWRSATMWPSAAQRRAAFARGLLAPSREHHKS